MSRNTRRQIGQLCVALRVFFRSDHTYLTSSSNRRPTVFLDVIYFTRKDSEIAHNELCGKLRQQSTTTGNILHDLDSFHVLFDLSILSVAALVDLTWGGWVKVTNIFVRNLISRTPRFHSR